jgi:lipid II:glycine glycyltransferase (peptidoglycan interpeptide bridge formation enzyme)
MIKIFTLSESPEWLDVVKSFKEADVYFYPEYCRAYQENGDGEPMLFYLEDKSGRVANVFLKRDLNGDKRFSKHIPSGKYYDISSVYGYGGPLVESSDFLETRRSFDREFSAFCKEKSIISDFVRFHCIYGNHKLMEGNYDIENIRTTVFMDSGKGEEHIWDDLDSTCRNSIHKALNAGITVEYGRDRELLDKFKELYKQTMDRNNASSYYYFNDRFFDETLEDLRDNSLIFAAKLDGRIIAANIVIFSGEIAHFHFGASDSGFLNLRPNNLLIYEIALWASRNGKKLFHLGGGAIGNDDNLFKFKKTFSKTNRLQFYIGKKVYNEPVYDELVKIRIQNDSGFNPDTNYFPKYRG